MLLFFLYATNNYKKLSKKTSSTLYYYIIVIKWGEQVIGAKRPATGPVLPLATTSLDVKKIPIIINQNHIFSKNYYEIISG